MWPQVALDRLHKVGILEARQAASAEVRRHAPNKESFHIYLFCADAEKELGARFARSMRELQI